MSTSPTPVTRKRAARKPAKLADHACSNCELKGISCSRIKPHCRECCTQGIKCSGFPMILIWGNGVASRGRLRGQSIPVPQSEAPPKNTQKSQSPNAQPIEQKTLLTDSIQATSYMGPTNAQNMVGGDAAFISDLEVFAMNQKLQAETQWNGQHGNSELDNAFPYISGRARKGLMNGRASKSSSASIFSPDQLPLDGTTTAQILKWGDDVSLKSLGGSDNPNIYSIPSSSIGQLPMTSTTTSYSRNPASKKGSKGGSVKAQRRLDSMAKMQRDLYPGGWEFLADSTPAQSTSSYPQDTGANIIGTSSMMDRAFTTMPPISSTVWSDYLSSSKPFTVDTGMSLVISQAPNSLPSLVSTEMPASIAASHMWHMGPFTSQNGSPNSNVSGNHFSAPFNPTGSLAPTPLSSLHTSPISNQGFGGSMGVPW